MKWSLLDCSLTFSRFLHDSNLTSAWPTPDFTWHKPDFYFTTFLHCRDTICRNLTFTWLVHEFCMTISHSYWGWRCGVTRWEGWLLSRKMHYIQCFWMICPKSKGPTLGFRNFPIETLFPGLEWPEFRSYSVPPPKLKARRRIRIISWVGWRWP